MLEIIEIRIMESDRNSIVQLRKTPMTFPRHGHAACWLGKNEIIVTGSKMPESGAAVEIYNTDEDRWTTHEPMNI